MGRPAIGKRAMTGAERQRRRRDKLKGDPETRAAQIADEILDFVGIDLACEVLEQCRRSDDDDDDGEPGCWHDFGEFGSRDEWPRLYHLLEELDELIDWEPENEPIPAGRDKDGQLLLITLPYSSALEEFLEERWDARQKEKEARAKAARNRRTRA